mmetsp:Transcript_38877/g.153718  ORF Transcript_38877/g.153718 Transcript_38877/m.153718 type:complete len:96 (-) Transcript_38877:355-642(-)
MLPSKRVLQNLLTGSYTLLDQHRLLRKLCMLYAIQDAATAHVPQKVHFKLVDIRFSSAELSSSETRHQLPASTTPYSRAVQTKTKKKNWKAASNP